MQGLVTTEPPPSLLTTYFLIQGQNTSQLIQQYQESLRRSLFSCFWDVLSDRSDAGEVGGGGVRVSLSLGHLCNTVFAAVRKHPLHNHLAVNY